MRSDAAGVFVRLVSGAMATLLLAACVVFPGEKPSDKPPKPLFVIGDVHGDFDDFVLLLRKTGLVDAKQHWSGADATLVQTGDLIDRGPKGRQVMDLLMALEGEAAKAGGEVLVLLGNHEVMNFVGDLRYVSAGDYAAFADGESEKRRKAAYAQFAGWRSSHVEFIAAIPPAAMPATEEEWMAQHPAGFVEYREAMSREGKYGKWLRKHCAVARLRDIIFLHGGISPNVSSLQIEEMNSKIRQEIEEFDDAKEQLIARNAALPFFTMQEMGVAVQAQLAADEKAEAPVDAEFHGKVLGLRGLGNWLCIRGDGPLWFRGYDEWSEAAGSAQMEKILAFYDARHIIVGHTVQKTAHIRSRFAGKVFLIDTGMLSTFWRGGRASALELRGTKFTAEYLDGQEVLLDDTPLTSTSKGN